MTDEVVECALVGVPRDDANGEWGFFIAAFEHEPGSLRRELTTPYPVEFISQVKAFRNWRECALAVAPIRDMLQQRLGAGALSAHDEQIGFRTSEFSGQLSAIHDVRARFDSLHLRGRRSRQPTSPFPPSWLQLELSVLRDVRVKDDVRDRWQRVSGAYPKITVDEAAELARLRLFAEFAQVARCEVSDRRIADAAERVWRKIFDLLTARPPAGAQQLGSADQIKDVIAIVEAMPTFNFCQRAITSLSADARVRLHAELNALGYETDVRVDVGEFGPLGILNACRAALKKITKPSRPDETEAARALAHGWTEVTGAGPRSRAANDFYSRINGLFVPGLQIRVERALR